MHRSIESLWKQTLGAAPDWDSLSGEESYRPSTLGSHPTEAAADPSVLERPEGGFVPISELGRGGMGTISSARQQRLRRVVALKQLRKDRGQAVAQQHFTIEALLCASLEHPNIVPIYDLDTQADGELFLAMKLVEGQSWRQLLQAEPKALRRHLDILLQLCNAVSFAHSRGVVHNDIKPANVMLGPYGEVLLVDWGLAVEIESRGALKLRPAASIRTPCGTPCYMPPELARGEGAAIGPWTDTYLLGGLLFQILSGHPPRQGNFLLLIEAAAEGEVAPLAEELPKELRAICLRALHPDPCQRFQQATDLQAALHDYLRHRESLQISQAAHKQLQTEALRTTSPGDDQYQGFAEAVAGFRHAASLWKDNPEAREGRRAAHLEYARSALRHGDLGLAASQLSQLEHALDEQDSRQQAFPELARIRTDLTDAQRARQQTARARKRLQRLLQISVVVIIIGLLVSTVVFATQNSVISNQNTEISAHLLEIEEQKEQAVTQRDRAENRGTIAREAFLELTLQVKRTLVDDARDSRALELAQDILASAQEGLQRLSKTEMAAGGLSKVTALALLQLAELRFQAEGDLEAALAELAACQRVFEQLVADDPDDASAFERLIFCHIYSARILESQAQAPAALQELTRAQQRCEARPLIAGARPALEARAQVVVLTDLSALHLKQGSLQQAEAEATRAVDVAERFNLAFPGSTESKLAVVIATGKLGRVQQALGHISQAYERYDQQRTLQTELWNMQPQNALTSYQLAQTCLNCGDMEIRLGQSDLAETSYRRARELLKILWQRSPLHRQTQQAYGQALQRLGVLYRGRSDFEASAQLLEEDVARCQRMTLLRPGDHELQEGLARSLFQRAVLYNQRAMLPEAREGLLEAAALVTRLDTTNIPIRELWSAQEAELADVLCKLGQPQAALAPGATALRLDRELVAQEPRSAEFLRSLSISLARNGAIYEALDQLPRAHELFEECQQLRRQLLSIDPENRQAQRGIAAGMFDLGRVQARLAGPAVALETFQAAVEIFQLLAEPDPDNRLLRKNILDGLIACVRYAAQADALEAAAGHLAQVRARLEPSPDNPDLFVRYSFALNMFGDALLRDEQPLAAAELFEEMLGLIERNLSTKPNDVVVLREYSVASGRLGDARWAGGQEEAARELYRVALDIQRRIAAGQPSVQRSYELSVFLHNLVRSAATPEERRDFALEELEVFHGLAAQLPDHPLVRQGRITVLEALAPLQAELAEHEAARGTLSELASCLAEDGRTEALQTLRQQLAEAPEHAGLRDAPGFEEWWQGLAE